MTHLRSAIVLGALLLTVLAVQAQDRKGERIAPSMQKESAIKDRTGGTHDKSNIRLFFENRGKLYPRNTSDGPGGEWPPASGHEYLYRVNPYVGVPRNVVQARWQSDEEWEAMGGFHNPVQTGRLSMAFSDRPWTWPASGWPIRDSLGNPVIKSDQDSYCVYSDSNNTKGKLGLMIRQTGYAFGVKFAADILFFKFEVVNFGTRTLDSLYFGLYNDFDIGDVPGGIQEYADDRVGIDTSLGFVYYYDSDWFSSEWGGTAPGVMGVAMLKTPSVNGQEKGVTDWHYMLYDDDYDLDTLQYGYMSSSPNLYASTLGSKFFHVGANYPNLHFDDPATVPAAGLDLIGMLSSGPYTLAPGESLSFVTAIVAGQNIPQALANARMAKKIVDFGFEVARPPVAPRLRADAADHRVTLYWDDRSETSRDRFSNAFDFEGYRLYKSIDKGATWDQIDRNINTSAGADPVPLAEFDKIDDIGDNTGLQYSYVDTNVVNGLEYWYSITAYDHGDATTPSLESPRGSNLELQNIVSVVPRQSAIGRTPPAAGTVVQSGTGTSDYRVIVSPTDQEAAAGRSYQISFAPTVMVEKGNPSTALTATVAQIDSTTFTSYAIRFNSATQFDVIDLTTKAKILASQPYVHGATVNFKGLTVSMVDPDTTVVLDFLPDIGDSIVVGPGIMVVSGPDTVMPLRFLVNSVPLATTNGVILMIQPSTYIRSGALIDGSGLTVSTVVAAKDSVVNDTYHILVVSVNDSAKSVNVEVRNGANALVAKRDSVKSGGQLTFKGITATLTFSAASLPPSGTRYDVETGVPKPLTYRDAFTFTTTTAAVSQAAVRSEMDKIRVVPNPYVVSSKYEVEFGPLRREPLRQINFTHLPPVCTIYIFTLTGDLVQTIYHNDATGVHTWDMRTAGGREITTGVYLYLVKTAGAEKLDRFAVIK